MLHHWEPSFLPFGCFDAEGLGSAEPVGAFVNLSLMVASQAKASAVERWPSGVKA
jgi:hypothetical protein